MAQQFNLTAQINLQSPKNVGRVVSDIQRQLKGSGLNTVNIKVKADPRSIAQTNRQLQNVSKNSRAAAKDIGTLNRSLQEATRRFSVITLATGSLLSFVTGFKNATKAAIEFERELVKISQVTGKSVKQLEGLTKEVTRLSTAFGVSSADLLNVSRTLAQAGFNAEKTRKSLDILAKTTLAATFDNIQDTTEGAIALLRQFGDEAKRTGGDVAFLEKSLSAINSVSKKFAVESGDLITVIRRVGGVFSSAGGSINELIALFTSVRATTRESAETIATGLRTIFTRIQRVETINQLKALNIQLQDSQGQFVGAFEAVKRLSQGLSGLNPRDFRFNQIVEQLGGFRQIGKVIPLIQQFATAQQALNVAQGASGSVAKDAQTAQQSLAVQIQKVREEFSALIRRFTDTGPFNSIATGALKIASAMIKVTEAVEPLLPLLTTMFGLKIGRALAPGLGRLAGISRSGTGGGAGFSRFNRGGMVPGSGNRDTVPAMLTPGEFVIRKSSVKKLGASRLAAMNQNRLSHGGKPKRIVAPAGGPTDFTHLDKIRSVPTKFKSKMSKLGVRNIDRLYSNLGLDLPSVWNNPGWTQKDNHGVFVTQLIDYVRKNKSNSVFSEASPGRFKRGIFGTLTGRSRSGKLSSPYTPSDPKVANLLNDSKITNSVVRNFTAGLGQIRGKFLDTDPDVIRAGVGDILLKSLKREDERLAIAFKEISTFKEKGGGRRGIAETNRPAASTAARRRKFALGGLATKNRMGFAILDPDQGGADLDAKVTRAQVRGAVSGTDAQRKALDKELSWSSKNYKVTRQGLPAKTSQKFYDTIAQEAANGVAVAANSLSNSLGLGSVSVPEDAKQTMAAVIKKSGSQMGVLFEDVLRVMDSKGPFSPAPKGAPFDFRGGLQGGLKSTYSKMPSTFVDARTSYARSTASAAQGKIIGELAEEYMFRSGSGTYKSATRQKRGPSASEASAAEKRRAKQQARMAKARERAGFAKGGAATDTIPALLTPGEFVFNAKAAKSIGHANLDRMNKRGIQGFARGGSVGERLSNARAGAASSLATIDPIAQSAQNFVFLGASVAAVTSQLSGMEDATKKAFNETAAFATGIIGIGSTLISSFSAMAASKSAEKFATDQNTTATLENTVATKTSSVAKKAEAGMGIVGKSLSALAIGVTAAATVFTFFSAKARANADQIAKATNESLQKLKSGSDQNVADIKAGYRKEAAARAEAAKFTLNPTKSGGALNLAGAAGGALAGGKAGAFVGSFFGPGIGTAIGGAIGAAIGGTAGAFGMKAFQNNEAAIKAETEARNREIKAIDQSIDSIALLGKASRQASKIESQIAAAPGLSAQEVASRRLISLDQLGDVRGRARLNEASADAQFIRQRVATATGKPASQLNEEDFKSVDESGALFSKYKVLQEEAASAQQNLNDRVKISATNLDALTSTLDGNKTFDELIAEGGQFAKSLKARQDAVRDAGLAERDAAARAVTAAEERTKIQGQSAADQAKSILALEEAKANERRVIENTARAYNDVEKSARGVVDGLNEQAEALAKSKAAQAAVDAEVRNLSRTSEMLDASLLSVANQAKAVDRFVAVLENRTSKIEASRVDEIDDITAIGDINKFAKQVREVSAKGGDATARIGESLIQSAAIMKRGQDALLGFDSRNLDETFDFEKLIRDATGLDKTSTPGGAGVFSEIVENLQELSAKGALSQEDVKSVFAPLAQVAQKQADLVGKLTDREQAGIDLYQQKLDALDAVRAKELEIRKAQVDALQRSADLNVRAANLLAKSIDPNALGIDPAAIQQKLADQAAQMSLDDLDLGLQAGNARQIARFRKQAQNNLLKLSQDENVTAKQRMSMERRFIRIIDVTGKELERLGDQSGKAGVLMGEMEKNISAIEKERAAREQITGVIEDFVIGGPEERGNLVSAANGIRQAFATGTLQMQTPEQRQATVGLLDRLGDVKLFGNITGKEIKKQLIFKDAIRLGLPPQLADAIANGTTTEEKLIQANRDLANQIQLLTMQMFMATMAMQANANAGDAAVAMAAAKGGPVYRNTGGTIFKPRGTDTVPAMLTPGEFVIRKSSVDQIGAGNLAALNNGDAAVVRSKGGPIYRAGGGPVNYLNNGGQGKTTEELLMAQYGIKTQSKGDFNKYFKDLDMRVARAHKEVSVGDITQNAVRFMSMGDPTGLLDVGNIAISAGRIAAFGDTTGDLRKSMGMDAAFAATSIVGGRAIAAGVGAAKRARAAKAAAGATKFTKMSGTVIAKDGVKAAANTVDPMVAQAQKFAGKDISALDVGMVNVGRSGFRFNRAFKSGTSFTGKTGTGRPFVSAAEIEKAIGVQQAGLSRTIPRNRTIISGSQIGAGQTSSVSAATRTAGETDRLIEAGLAQPYKEFAANAQFARNMRAVKPAAAAASNAAKVGPQNLNRGLEGLSGIAQGVIKPAFSRGKTLAEAGSKIKNVGAGGRRLSGTGSGGAGRGPDLFNRGVENLASKIGGKIGAGFRQLFSKPSTPANLGKQFKEFLSGGGAVLAVKPALVASVMQQYEAAGGVITPDIAAAANGMIALGEQQAQQKAEREYLSTVDESLKKEVQAEIDASPWLFEDRPQQTGLGRDERYTSQLRAFSSTNEAGVASATERLLEAGRSKRIGSGEAQRAIKLENRRQKLDIGGLDAQGRQKELVKQILIKQEKEKRAAEEKRLSAARMEKFREEQAIAQQKEAKRKGDFESLMANAAEARKAGQARIEANKTAYDNRMAKINEDIEAGKQRREAAKKEEQKIQKSGGPMGIRTFFDRYNEEYGGELADLFKDNPRMAQQLITAKYQDYRQALREGVTNYRTTGPSDTTLKYRKKSREDMGLDADIFYAKGGPVYRRFGGGIGYARGGYNLDPTMGAARRQMAMGNQFLNQRYQAGMNFMNQMRNRALSYNISRPGFQNFAGGMSLRARKPSMLYPFKAGGEQVNVDIEQFNRILRTQGPKPALRFAFRDKNGRIPQGAYIGPRGVAQQQQEELTPEQMNRRMMQMMMQQLQRMEARQAQQNRNAGGVRPLGMATGGGVPGGDTVPAMLTPGEFVMSAGAVRQHGIGTMRALNRGQVPGFNRGGMVGGVQYRQNGGLMGMISGAAQSLGIDTKEITSTFDNFVGNFSGVLDNITKAFSPMTSAIQNLANIFGGSEGIKMTHNHTVTIAAGSAETKLDAQTIDQIAKLAADYVKPILPDGNDFNVA